MRVVTRQLAALMWQSVGRADRAAAVLDGQGRAVDAFVEAITALDAEKRAEFSRAIRLVAEATARPPS